MVQKGFKPGISGAISHSEDKLYFSTGADNYGRNNLALFVPVVYQPSRSMNIIAGLQLSKSWFSNFLENILQQTRGDITQAAFIAAEYTIPKYTNIKLGLKASYVSNDSNIGQLSYNNAISGFKLK